MKEKDHLQVGTPQKASQERGADLFEAPKVNQASYPAVITTHVTISDTSHHSCHFRLEPLLGATPVQLLCWNGQVWSCFYPGQTGAVSAVCHASQEGQPALSPCRLTELWSPEEQGAHQTGNQCFKRRQRLFSSPWLPVTQSLLKMLSRITIFFWVI